MELLWQQCTSRDERIISPHDEHIICIELVNGLKYQDW